ncbi:zinc finger and BTB domain-containing protein 18.2-like isoform X1 [Haliotis rufescens]|uniref:zinc finger and BTB domain-containing protein 18.2-like isoform X1 n=1 Tax=Haliotis rufescens TaxID=6454 RepID=UPI001EB0600D|nr:zinc finger and BTB domain-containing protein 18.2-like isoform X1 [Haliotis rufescens]
MFIETLQFTIPIDLCTVFSSLQKGPKSNLEFPASVNSYGTTQDANIQVALHANKLTFTVDGVSSNASMISKSECKTLRLSVFDVDRSLIPQESEVVSYGQMSTSVTVSTKRLHDNTSSTQPASKSSRTEYLESTPIRSPARRIPHAQSTSSPSNNTHSKSQNDTSVNVKQEPEDPDLIEIEPDPEPDGVVPKTETPYMQIDYSSDVPHTQTSQAALDRLSHPQSSHSQSPGSSSSSFHQNVPHVPDYAGPSTSQVRHGDQSADDYLVFQDDNDYGDDNEADYSNDGQGGILAEYSVQIPIRPFDTQGKLLEADMFRLSESHSNPPGIEWPGTPQCTECGKTFSSVQSCRRHVDQVHRKLCFTCECGKGFARTDDLKRHKAAAHENQACYCVCGKSYVYARNLRKHQKTCPIFIERLQN